MPLRFLSLCVAAVVANLVMAQAQVGTSKEAESWDVTKPRGATREIDFVTSEGTWMSVDLSADGRWIVFDLLGHIYRVAAAGGEAECLTQSSGVGVNFQAVRRLSVGQSGRAAHRRSARDRVR